MTEETGAAAPATEQAVTAPAVTEQATPETSVQTDAVTENAEPKAETEQGEESPDKPKGLSRNQRLQRKAARLSTMVADQAARIEELQKSQGKPDETEPKETDYNGDWTKYQADYAAWKAAKTVEQKFAEREQKDVATRLNERRQEAADDFQERAEQIKTGIPDFDKAISDFEKSGGKFANHVIEELLESEKGPLLAYQLAKNPSLAAELNALSPRDAAREIGRLEAKATLPQPRTQTKAPAPLSTLTGGAAPATDLRSLAKSDDASAYWAARKAQQKASA